MKTFCANFSGMVYIKASDTDEATELVNEFLGRLGLFDYNIDNVDPSYVGDDCITDLEKVVK